MIIGQRRGTACDPNSVPQQFCPGPQLKVVLFGLQMGSIPSEKQRLSEVS